MESQMNKTLNQTNDRDTSYSEDNNDQVLTAFDFVSQLENSLELVLKNISHNDKQFNKSYQLIQEKLHNLENQISL